MGEGSSCGRDARVSMGPRGRRAWEPGHDCHCEDGAGIPGGGASSGYCVAPSDWRSRAMSREGGAPNIRLYSRLNCEGLS
ncbi:hypothetical protein COSO111634_28240 [Corallococcus soli]